MSNIMYKTPSQATIQWIISLAISVICCAVLFIVFAGYLLDVHNSVSLNTIRLEVLQERQNQLSSEIDYIRHPIPVNAGASVAPQYPAPQKSAEPDKAP